MKKRTKILAVSATIGAIAFGAIGCSGSKSPDRSNPDEHASAYVSLLGAVDMTVSNNGKIVSLAAATDEGAIILSGLDFGGESVETATEEIVKTANKLGYIDETASVKVIVAGETDGVEESVKNATSAPIEGSSRSLERELAKLKEATTDSNIAELDAAKLRLIKTVMRYDDEMTVADGAALSVAELANSLKAKHIKYGELVTSELKARYDALKDEKEREFDTRISEIYGKEYSALSEKLYHLEKLHDEFEAELESVTISAADSAKLAELIGVDASTFSGMTVEQVEDFIDEFEDRLSDEQEDAFDDIEDTVEDILDALEDGENLTETMRSKLAQFNVDFATLDELDEYIDELEDELEDLKDVELSADQKAEIQRLEREKDDIEDQLEAEIEAEIAIVKDELKAIKEELLNAVA